MSIRFILSLMIIVGVVGCERDDNPSSYSSSYYDDDGYARVFVDNQSPYRVMILVGNAKEEVLEPGRGDYISKRLVHEQELWISVMFLDNNGVQISSVGPFGFRRSNQQRNLVAYGPGDVRKY